MYKQYLSEDDIKHDGNNVKASILPQVAIPKFFFLQRQDQRSYWILKPSNSNNGHGIEVKEVGYWNIDEFKNMKGPTIIQKYIHNPFLIRNHKFDMRLYVLITTFDPLTIYLYGDGLVR